MFPGAGATIYRNEAGEPVGWDLPYDGPPEPRNPDDEPYRSDAVAELSTRLTDAEIAAETAEFGSLTLTRVHWKVLREIDHGAEDVTLTSADGSVYIGTVQDYDADRAEVTIELR
jgi:hypothetical protein